MSFPGQALRPGLSLCCAPPLGNGVWVEMDGWALFLPPIEVMRKSAYFCNMCANCAAESAVAVVGSMFVGARVLFVRAPFWVRACYVKISVLSEFKSEMPRPELNLLPTRLGATRLHEEVKFPQSSSRRCYDQS